MFVVLAVVIGLASAPRVSAIGFGVGVYGGYNHSNFNYPGNAGDVLGAKFNPLYSVGAYASLDFFNFGVPLVPYVVFQADVAYSTKGGAAELLALKTKIKYDYLEIPLLIKLRFPLFILDVYGLGGVSLSFFQGGNAKMTIPGLPEVTASIENARSFNPNYIVGGGVAFGFLFLFEFFLEVRHLGGLSDITKGIPNSPKHSDIYILAGFGLKI